MRTCKFCNGNLEDSIFDCREGTFCSERCFNLWYEINNSPVKTILQVLPLVEQMGKLMGEMCEKLNQIKGDLERKELAEPHKDEVKK